MAEDTHRLVLPSHSGVSNFAQANEKQFSARETLNAASAASAVMESDLSSWPVCRHYPECEICEQCAMHSVYQKRVSVNTSCLCLV